MTQAAARAVGSASTGCPSRTAMMGLPGLTAPTGLSDGLPSGVQKYFPIQV